MFATFDSLFYATRHVYVRNNCQVIQPESLQWFFGRATFMSSESSCSAYLIAVEIICSLVERLEQRLLASAQRLTFATVLYLNCAGCDENWPLAVRPEDLLQHWQLSVASAVRLLKGVTPPEVLNHAHSVHHRWIREPVGHRERISDPELLAQCPQKLRQVCTDRFGLTFAGLHKPRRLHACSSEITYEIVP